MKELNPFVLRTSARSLHYVFLIGLLAGSGLVTAGTYTQSFEFGDGTTNLGDGSVINSNNGTAAKCLAHLTRKPAARPSAGAQPAARL